jgi:hypothetical protein
MSAKSSKGVQISLTGPADNTDSYKVAKITDISNTAPVILGATNTAKPGDIVAVAGTTYKELDGKYFVAGPNTTATEIELLGSDGTKAADQGTFTGEAWVYSETTNLCLNALAINADTPGTISVATYCDPTASLPATVAQAGTLTFGGFVDVTAEDYPALLSASEDGLKRIIRIELPDNGFIVAPITVASLTWDLPLDGAIGFNGSATLASKPVHRF